MKSDITVLIKAVVLCDTCESTSVILQNAQRIDLLEEANQYRDQARALLEQEARKQGLGRRERDFLASTLGLCHYACCSYGEKRIAERLGPYIQKQAKR